MQEFRLLQSIISNIEYWLPVFAFQIATVLSAEQDIIVDSVGHLTSNTAFLCPRNTL